MRPIVDVPMKLPTTGTPPSRPATTPELNHGVGVDVEVRRTGRPRRVPTASPDLTAPNAGIASAGISTSATAALATRPRKVVPPCLFGTSIETTYRRSGLRRLAG